MALKTPSAIFPTRITGRGLVTLFVSSVLETGDFDVKTTAAKYPIIRTAATMMMVVPLIEKHALRSSPNREIGRAHV